MPKLYRVVRPKRYTGPILEAPNQELVGEYTEASKETLETVYDQWAEQFFVKHPRGQLRPSISRDNAVVRGTGDGGRWLVAWHFVD